VGKGHASVRRRKQAGRRRRLSRLGTTQEATILEEKTVNVEGITWHAIVLEPEPFAATKALMSETFGLAPEVEDEGMVLFIMPNGTMLELNTPQAASADYAINDGLVFGFRVDDVEAASAAVEEAGCELLGEITRVEEVAYAYRRFRGPDGRVYSLNEQK
jgi:predicted enzyme related to lactoylglutathione lyase